MGAARMYTVSVHDATGRVQRRQVVAVREMLPGHLVYNPPITLQAGESLHFDPPLETAFGGQHAARSIGTSVEGHEDTEGDAT